MCVCAWCPPLSRYCGSLNRDRPLPVRVHRVQSRPAGLSDYPECRLQRCSYTVVPPKPPDSRDACRWWWSTLGHSVPVWTQSSLLFLTVAWQFAPVCQQPRAIKPMLSAVLSAGHRQWGRLIVMQQRHCVPPGVRGVSATHRKRGRTGSLCLAPGWPAQALMPTGTRANDSHFPPGLRRSRRPLRIRLRICSE